MSLLTKLSRRIRLLLSRRRVEQDMDEEMRFHLEQETRELERAGHTPAAARRAALVAFGGVQSAKEDSRDARGGRALDDLLADIRYALRQALRAPAHAAAVVGILAPALMGAALALALARAYLHRPLPFPEPERLVSVIAAPSRDPLPNPPDLRDVDWAPAAELFEVTGAWDLDGFTVMQPGATPEYLDGAWVSPGFFDLRGLHPVLGRPFLAEEYVPGSNVALLSDAVWRRRFAANPAVVGSSVRMYSTDRPDEDALVTIVGVLPPTAWQLRFSEVIRPLGTPRMFSIARLPSGVSAAVAAERLTAAIRAQRPGIDADWRMTLVSAQDEHVYAIRPLLQVLVATALLLLLLAHTNVGALLLARTSARLHELGIRRALGAGRGRIARQLSVEAALLAGIALLLALTLAPLLTGTVAGWIERFGGISVPGGLAAVRLDPVVTGAVLLVTVLSFGLFSLAPSLRTAALPATASTTSMRATPGRGVLRLRRLLTTLQVAAAVALLAQGALLFQSVRAMLQTELGFEPERLLKAHLLLPRGRYPDPASRSRAFDGVIARVAAIPGVESAAGISPHPFRGTAFAPVECDGCAGGSGTTVLAAPQTVTAGYFTTMGIPLLSGRLFDQRDDPGASPSAVVSQALADRLWPDGQAIGKRLRQAGRAQEPWLTVVGVVRDVRKTYSDSLYPDVYQAFAQAPRAYAALMVRTMAHPGGLGDAVRRAVMAEEESLALSDLEPMTELLKARRGRAAILAGIVGGIAVLAFVLTIVGLYSVVSYLGRLRQREYAVRTALGARPSAIVRAVLGEAWGMLGLGLLLGAGAAAAVARLTRAYLVGVSPLDPSTYGVVIGVTVVVLLAALVIPARRAAAVDPVTVLREE
jgi:putative ABC transport system permease protein